MSSSASGLIANDTGVNMSSELSVGVVVVRQINDFRRFARRHDLDRRIIRRRRTGPFVDVCVIARFRRIVERELARAGRERHAEGRTRIGIRSIGSDCCTRRAVGEIGALRIGHGGIGEGDAVIRPRPRIRDARSDSAAREFAIVVGGDIIAAILVGVRSGEIQQRRFCGLRRDQGQPAASAAAATDVKVPKRIDASVTEIASLLVAHDLSGARIERELLEIGRCREVEETVERARQAVERSGAR